MEKLEWLESKNGFSRYVYEDPTYQDPDYQNPDGWFCDDCDILLKGCHQYCPECDNVLEI